MHRPTLPRLDAPLAQPFALALVLALLATTLPVRAADLQLSLTDQQGRPVQDAVVYVTHIDGQVPASTAQDVVVDQIDETFVPHVRATTVGSRVSFPNSDHIRHHVYSFSDTRTFELPLYIGIPAEPVVFDKPGVVTLGCNIHDHMLGYILVLDTPWFTEIADGSGVITGLPEATLAVEIWHPRLEAGEPLRYSLPAAAGTALQLEAQLQLRPERKLRRAPRRGSSQY